MRRKMEGMMEKPAGRKLLSPEERLELVLLALGKDQTLEALCSQAGVSRALLYRWMRQTREASLKALEAKRPGRKPSEPERAASKAQTLEQRLESLQKETAQLRKERDHQELLAQTAQRIIRRRGWEESPVAPLKKKRGRPPKNATSANGASSAGSAPQPGPTPAAGASAAAPTGAGSTAKSEANGRA